MEVKISETSSQFFVEQLQKYDCYEIRIAECLEADLDLVQEALNGNVSFNTDQIRALEKEFDVKIDELIATYLKDIWLEDFQNICDRIEKNM